jgi:hypothetical protein
MLRLAIIASMVIFVNTADAAQRRLQKCEVIFHHNGHISISSCVFVANGAHAKIRFRTI